MSSRLSILSALTLIGALLSPALANSSFPQEATPQARVVAVIPVPNLSLRSWSELKQRQSQRAYDEMVSVLQARGYAVIDQSATSSAVAAQGVDYAIETNWTSANFEALGQAVHANLVAFIAITDTHEGWRHGLLLLYPQREGEVKTVFYVADAGSGQMLVNGDKEAGKARESEISGFVTNGIGEGSSKYTLGAVTDAVDKSLHSLP